MTHVFARVHYDVLNMTGFFKDLHEFVGPFHIQQTIQQGHDKVFDLWFYTDKVQIKEGDTRQVEIICTLKDGKLFFEITK